MRSRRALLAAAAATAIAAALLACSTSPKLVAAGGECFQATDCEDGLVCAPAAGQPNGKRTCTSDLSAIQMVPPNGAPDASMDAGPRRDAPPSNDAMMTVDTNPPDDTNPPPPVDTGTG